MSAVKSDRIPMGERNQPNLSRELGPKKQEMTIDEER